VLEVTFKNEREERGIFTLKCNIIVLQVLQFVYPITVIIVGPIYMVVARR
jgi:hypothetical protein